MERLLKLVELPYFQLLRPFSKLRQLLLFGQRAPGTQRGPGESTYRSRTESALETLRRIAVETGLHAQKVSC